MGSKLETVLIMLHGHSVIQIPGQRVSFTPEDTKAY